MFYEEQFFIKAGWKCLELQLTYRRYEVDTKLSDQTHPFIVQIEFPTWNLVFENVSLSFDFAFELDERQL